jgi:uncharacterized membrane protein YczE
MQIGKPSILDKNKVRRILMVCVGILLMGFAISLSVYANFGTDPCTCMNLGVSGKLRLSFGVWQLLFNLVVLAIMFFLSRRLIGIGTVVNMVSIGFLVDFFRSLFAQYLPSDPPIPVRILVMAAAVVLLSFTAALYMYPKLGVSPFDSLAIILSERTGLQYRWCRVIFDVTAVVIGWLCGSVVGVGTVITAFFMGPLIKAFTDLIAKRFHFEPDEKASETNT